jgi:hypothetical protein
MPSKLRELLDEVERKREALDEAEGERNGFLRAPLEALGIYEGIEDVYIQGKYLHIAIERYRDGTDGYNYPLSIFEADDPIAAAQTYKAQSITSKEASDRALKLATLTRLQKELGLATI